MKNVLISFTVIGLSVVSIVLFSKLSGGSIESPVESLVQQKSEIGAYSKSNEIDTLTSATLDANNCLDAQFISKAMNSAPEETFVEIGLLPNSQNKEVCYKNALLAWSEIDYNALYYKVVSLTPNTNLDLAIISLVEKYNSDVAYGIEFSAKIFSDDLKEQQFVKLLPVWATEDPSSALSWAMIQTTQSSIKWIELIINTVSLIDMSSAISTLTILQDAQLDQLRAAIQTIINNFDPALANADILSVIASLESERLKAELIVGLLPLMFASDNISLADLNYLIGSLSPGQMRDELYQSLASNWVFMNPSEAAAYAESLEGDVRELAISAVVSTWMHEDLNAVDAWLRTLNGNIDVAAEALGRGASEIGNIEISNNWLDVIEDDEARTNAAIDIVHARYKRSPAVGLYHLVFQKNISEQKKLEILHEIYPNEVFLSPSQALDEFGRLENVRSALEPQNEQIQVN